MAHADVPAQPAQVGPIGVPTDEAAPPDVAGEAFRAYGRAVWIGLLSGLGVGVVLGVANRLIMRVVAVMNGPTPIETDFGATVLNFTVGGTLFLIIATMLVAIAPGMLYVGIRRLLPGGTLIGGLTYGILLAVVAGTTVVDGDTRDFRFLGEPMVSAAMFLGLFVAFGLLVAPLAARLDRRISRDPSEKVVVLYGLVGGILVLIIGQVLFRGVWTWLLMVPLVFALAVTAGERRGDAWTRHRSRIRVGGYLALAVPFLPGLIDLGQELSLIAQA